VLTVTPKFQLSLIGITILGSVIYGFLVAYSPEFARTIMLGYIGLILTVFLVIEGWRRL